jgi:glutaredoxin-like protein
VIPLREQEAIRQRFEQELSGRLRIDYFTQRQSPVIVPGRQDCVHCEDVRAMLDEIAHLHPRVSLAVHELADATKLAAELGVDKVPGIALRGASNRVLRFAGFPAGLLFPGFIDTIIEAGRGDIALKPETQRQLKRLKDDVAVQVFVTPVCRYSPPVARAALKMALASSHVGVEVVEAAEFPQLVQRLGLRSTPSTLVGGRLMLSGAIDEATLLQAVFRVVEGKPLSASDFQPGPATPLPVAEPQGQQQPRTTTTPSGIILPR